MKRRENSGNVLLKAFLVASCIVFCHEKFEDIDKIICICHSNMREREGDYVGMAALVVTTPTVWRPFLLCFFKSAFFIPKDYVGQPVQYTGKVPNLARSNEFCSWKCFPAYEIGKTVLHSICMKLACSNVVSYMQLYWIEGDLYMIQLIISHIYKPQFIWPPTVLGHLSVLEIWWQKSLTAPQPSELPLQKIQRPFKVL